MQKKKKIKKLLNPREYDSKYFFVCNLESGFLKSIIQNNSFFRLTLNKDYKEKLKSNGVCLLGKIRVGKKKFATVYIDNNQPLDGVMMARKGQSTIYTPYLNIQAQKATNYGMNEDKLSNAVII